MVCGVVKSVVVARASSLLRVSGVQATIISPSTFPVLSTNVVGGGGAKRVSTFCAGCLGNQWSFRVRFSAAQDLMNVGLRGLAHGRTRRGGGGDRGTLPLVSATAVEDNEELEEGEWRSRNQSKRDSKRARQWGLQLATLSPDQVKQAVRWARLPEDVYDAVMIVKNLGMSSRVRNGRRRQYNYIGGLLRDVDPNVMEPVLKATKDGDVEGVMFNSRVLPDPADIDVNESWAEETEEDSHQFLAEAWLHGLIRGISAVEDEVYSIYDIDYDRQELRKLVRSTQKESFVESSATSEPSMIDGVDSPSISTTESKSYANLRHFLINIARQQIENEAALL